MTLAAGAPLGPYKVIGLLGAGGMGEVYRARESRLGREVALKVLPERFRRSPGRLERLRREAKLLASLNHLLFGHTQTVNHIAVSPDGRWIAPAADDETIRLWPMPDTSEPPLHTLPYERLLAKLRSLTNLRVVPDADSDTGYTLEPGPFPGWRDVPTW